MSQDAVRDTYLSWTAARIKGEPPDPEGEAWGDLTAEPRAVDYIETEVSGRPAMWAVPHRCSEDRDWVRPNWDCEDNNAQANRVHPHLA
jgi:hypothetical protein